MENSNVFFAMLQFLTLMMLSCIMKEEYKIVG